MNFHYTFHQARFERLRKGGFPAWQARSFCYHFSGQEERDKSTGNGEQLLSYRLLVQESGEMRDEGEGKEKVGRQGGGGAVETEPHCLFRSSAH